MQARTKSNRLLDDQIRNGPIMDKHFLRRIRLSLVYVLYPTSQLVYQTYKVRNSQIRLGNYDIVYTSQKVNYHSIKTSTFNVKFQKKWLCCELHIETRCHCHPWKHSSKIEFFPISILTFEWKYRHSRRAYVLLEKFMILTIENFNSKQLNIKFEFRYEKPAKYQLFVWKPKKFAFTLFLNGFKNGTNLE